nr:uncharacterized protein LOC112769958 [Arachis hypogaea]
MGGPAVVNEKSDSDDYNYKYASEECHTPVSSEDERTMHGLNFNEENEYGEVQFELGMQFSSMERFKKALKDVFVWDGRDCMYIKNEKERVRARCAEENCPWLIYVARNSKTMAFEIKTFHNKHTCGRDYGSNLADRKWVTDKLEKRLATQPKLTPREATEHMKQDYNVQVHPKMIQRALKAAREIVVGNDQAQYGKLWDYLQELHRSNPGSTADMCVDPIPQSLPLFDKIYICLDACRNGFVKGCRPLIGLDGCFLKGYYGGQLLTAMSLDANNHVFVIAYAVIRAENTENWMWFLTRLQDDLGDHQVRGWNLMSNQQKDTARKNKKKMPKRPHVEPDEINISQTAPTAEVNRDTIVNFFLNTKDVVLEPKCDSLLFYHVPETDQTTPMNQATTQAPKAQPHSAAPKFRPKQMVRRPLGPPVQSNEPPHNVQAQTEGQGLQRTSHVISNETLVAASTGTSSRLFKFIPTPGMKPPPKNQ